MKRIYLVSCVAKKCSGFAAAEDMYNSTWFQYAKKIVKETGSPWFILSAKYGLVHPNEQIKSYNQTLNTMPVKERKKWAEKVLDRMKHGLPEADQIVMFAGMNYRKYLMDYLIGRYGDVQIPMEGLRFGQQLSCLKKRSSSLIE